MTMRDIFIALTRIGIRKHNDYAIAASLKGVKVPFKQVAPSIGEEEMKVSKKMEEKINRDLEETRKRLAERVKRRG